jgi:branched-chain amino acid transport system permease protein
MGFTPVLKAFIAAVIGGFGSIAGAVLGGYVLGFLEVLVTSLAGIGDLLPAGSVSPEVRQFLHDWLPSGLASWRDAVVFIVLIIVLLVRPQGILGRRQQGDEG